MLLTADPETCVRRFAARDLASPHARASRAAVDAAGGDDVVREYHSALQALVVRRPWVHVVEAREGEADRTYAEVLAAVT